MVCACQPIRNQSHPPTNTDWKRAAVCSAIVLVHHMQYAEEVGTLSTGRVESGLLGRGPLDSEGSVR